MHYRIILNKQRLMSLISDLSKAEYFAFDTETTSKNSIEAELVGMSFCYSNKISYYLPLKHDYTNVPTQLDLDFVLSQLKDILEQVPSKIIGQNIKYDKNVLAKYGIDLQYAHDTMLMSYVLDSTQKHNMDDLAKDFLGVKTIKYKDVAGSGKNQLPFNKITLEKATPYAAEDAAITLQLFEKMFGDLRGNIYEVYRKIELPLIKVLARMEQNGVFIDSYYLKEQSAELSQKITSLTTEIYWQAKQVFNIDSPKQLQKILYEDLKIPVIEKTPSGQLSTSESVLTVLSKHYILPNLILQYRGLKKLKSTYVDKLPKMLDKKTGRVHASFNQAGTTTGRLSSSDPNLQNIPIRSEEGKKIREAFIAHPGFKIMAADYSQIELRILAHMSQDPTLLEAFNTGGDIHTKTASQVFNVPIEKITNEQRRAAKSINFGLVYGMSEWGLAKNLDIPVEKAEQYIMSYFEQYPGVKEYVERYKKLAHDKGYVETLFGRRLYLPHINSKSFKRQLFAERNAINAPIQGTAADIMKYAMIDLDYIIKNDPNIKMVIQVHDELVFEVKETRIDWYKGIVLDAMENTVKLEVPLTVDVGIGNNWLEAH